jgi:DNA-binding HxlR family transcriptional regulator
MMSASGRTAGAEAAAGEAAGAEAAAAEAAAAEARSVSPEECGPAAAMLARAFRFLGKRWNALILGHLSGGPAGFRDLSRAIGGISDSVLSDRLTDLAAGGLVSRTVSEGPPLAVSYQLTERGQALMPALQQIALWARDNLPDADC